MNKVCRVVGICDILVGIIDLMNSEIMMGIAMLLTEFLIMIVMGGLLRKQLFQ